MSSSTEPHASSCPSRHDRNEDCTCGYTATGIPSTRDLYDEFGEMHPDAIWCDRCQGSGIAQCYCGGDQCYCENYGEMECPRCHSEGYWVPPKREQAAQSPSGDSQ